MNEIEKRREEIKDLLRKIQNRGLEGGDAYSFDKHVISKLFANTDEKGVDDILLRLTVIDSMYSTQMDKRYYGLADLANAMYALQKEKNRSLADMFTDFAKTPDASMFDYSGGNLWGNNYGIGKDGKPKGGAVSLISKYAYFTTHYQFPIFDSIVCDEMLPILSKYLDLQNNPLVKLDGKQRNLGKEKMVRFVTKINKFISELDPSISYDTLDRLLWSVGKIMRGNLSLILSKDEYLQWTKTHKIENKDDVVFDVTKDRYEDISPFLNPKNKDLLEQFFKLAKKLDDFKKLKTSTKQ